MTEETKQKLLNIADQEWRIIIAKCHTHVQLKLKGKVDYGAHCERRLGMKAEDYYVGNAIVAIYEGRWIWHHEKYPIEEQLCRIIDSLISHQVEKYVAEKQRAEIVAVDPSLFDFLPLNPDQEADLELEDMEHFSKALEKAIHGNSTYIEFIRLKKEGFSYEDICKYLNCTKQEAYRISENIARRAKQLLN